MFAEPVLMESWQEDQSISSRGPVEHFLRQIAGLDLMVRSLGGDP